MAKQEYRNHTVLYTARNKTNIYRVVNGNNNNNKCSGTRDYDDGKRWIREQCAASKTS